MPELHGNTTGLSPSATRTLEHVYRRRVPLARIATPELVRSLADARAAWSDRVLASVLIGATVVWLLGLWPARTDRGGA
mgnify:CR=1 FL=1